MIDVERLKAATDLLALIGQDEEDGCCRYFKNVVGLEAFFERGGRCMKEL